MNLTKSELPCLTNELALSSCNTTVIFDDPHRFAQFKEALQASVYCRLSCV